MSWGPAPAAAASHHGRRQCGRRRCRQGPRWERREARGRRHDPAQRRGGDLSRDTPQARGNRRAQKLQPARASNSRRRLLSSSPRHPSAPQPIFPKTRSCPTQTPSWTPPGSPPARSVNLHRLHRPVPGNNGRTRLRPPASLHRRRGPTTQQLDDRRRHSFGCQPRRPGYPRRVAGEQLHEAALVIQRREGHPRRQQHPPEEHDGLALRPGGARRVREQRPAAAPKARHLEPGNVSHGRVRRAHGPGPDAASAAKLPRRELPLATLRRLVQGDPEEDPCLAGLDVLRAGRRKLNLSEHEPHR